MGRPEIRKIMFTDFKQHMGQEIKFVTRDNGHLWLCFRGKPRAVIIPMRDEALLHEIRGRDFKEVLHKANVRHARKIRALWREKMYQSEMVEDDGFEVPPMQMTDEEWAEHSRWMFKMRGPVR